MGKDILISTQRALLGMIYPDIRAIAIDFDEMKTFTIVCYLDREPVETDYENLSEISSEVCADFEFQTVDEQCVFSLNPISMLNSHKSWVYVRQEYLGLMG